MAASDATDIGRVHPRGSQHGPPTALASPITPRTATRRGSSSQRCDSEDRRDDRLRRPSTPSGQAPKGAPIGEYGCRHRRGASRFPCVSLHRWPRPLRLGARADDVAASPRRLTDVSMSVGYPAWSPDERRIAVEIKDGSSTQAGVLDLETGVIRRLTDARGQTWVRNWSPRWSQSGGGRAGQKVSGACVHSTRAVDRTNAESAPGPPPRVLVRYPDWSARGDLIVFERAEMTQYLAARSAAGQSDR